MSKGVHDSSGCARHRSVYVCITVKGSRVCEHCNVLVVRKYVHARMVEGYTPSQNPSTQFTISSRPWMREAHSSISSVIGHVIFLDWWFPSSPQTIFLILSMIELAEDGITPNIKQINFVLTVEPTKNKYNPSWPKESNIGGRPLFR